MQRNKTTYIVLTIYTALCGLYKTANAVSIEKRYNIYTCAHTYISRYSMRKSQKSSMMILNRNSMMILFRNSILILFENRMIILFKNSMMVLLENSMMILIKICITIIHIGAHILL